MKIKQYLLLLITLAFLMVLSVELCQATILPTPTGDKPSSGCMDSTNCGNYKLDDFAAIAVKVAEYILGISGSLALLFFIYGGIMFLISGGQSDKINSAKQILINSIIGIVIIFTAYTIIGFVITNVLKIDNGANWNTLNWYKK